MIVILTLKGVHKPQKYKNMTKSISIIQLKGNSNERVREPPGANISDSLRGLTALVLKTWLWLTIFQGVAAAVGDNSWDRGVCEEKLGGAFAYNYVGARDLTETVVSPTYVVDIWLDIMLVETVHVA